MKYLSFSKFCALALLLLWLPAVMSQGIGPVLPQPTMGADLSAGKLLPGVDPYCGRDSAGDLKYPDTLPAADEYTVETPSCLVVTLGSSPNITRTPDDATAGVVDWVLVEVRSVASDTVAGDVGGDASTVQKPGLLLTNGILVDAEGFSAADATARNACLDIADPFFNTTACGEFMFNLPAGAFTMGNDHYVVVRHRFHLDVMSAAPLATPVSGGGGDYVLDLSSTETSVHRGSSAVNPINGGANVVMLSGDANMDGVIDTGDIEVGFLTPLSNDQGVNRYSPGDSDMNRNIDTNDVEVGFLTPLGGNRGLSLVPK